MYLNDNVYMVLGAVGAILYNFNNGNVYWLNKESKTFLNEYLNNMRSCLSGEEQTFINNLFNKGILTEEVISKHDIHDLKIKPSIDFVWIEITTGCNLQCIHCYDEASPSKLINMDYEYFKHIIDELEKNNIKKLQIIGGEPFILGSRLKDYLDYCIGKFDYLEIFTNGTLIDDAWIEYLHINNINIALSVYSYNEDEHNKVTKSQISHRLTNMAIEKLYDKNIKYRVKNVIMANLDLGRQNTQLYELSNKKDIVRMVGRANTKLLDENLLKRKLITRNSFTNKVSKSFVQRMVSGHNCFSKRLYFSVDGNVYPCVMERRISHGNFKNFSLSEFLKEEIISFNKDYICECKNCEYRYSCFDCRPDSLGKSIIEKPWYCTYNPLEGTWMKPEDFINMLKEQFEFS